MLRGWEAVGSHKRCWGKVGAKFSFRKLAAGWRRACWVGFAKRQERPQLQRGDGKAGNRTG